MGLYPLPTIAFLSEIAVLVVAISLRRMLTTSMKVLGIYFLLSVLTGVVQTFYAVQHIENLWTVQMFLPVEFVLPVLVFYFSPEFLRLRWFLLICIIIFLTVWGSLLTWTNTISPSYPYLKTADSLFVIALSCYMLIRIVKDDQPAPLKQPLFWVAVGNLISFGSTIPFFALSSRIFEASIQTMLIASSAELVADFIANGIYFKGFLCLRRN